MEARMTDSKSAGRCSGGEGQEGGRRHRPLIRAKARDRDLQSLVSPSIAGDHRYILAFPCSKELNAGTLLIHLLLIVD